MNSARQWLKVVAWCAVACLGVLPINAQNGQPAAEENAAQLAKANAPDIPASTRSAGLLHQFSESLQQLADKVSPSVVQIMVTGYGPAEDHDRTDAAVIRRQHTIGSGVIVDPNGYIITNAHVIEGAERIRVLFPSVAAIASKQETLEMRPTIATVVGVHQQTDLALLKVDVKGLAALDLSNYRGVHQGEIVVALGSPQGLENTMTLGIVSAASRQPDPDSPMAYIQTDAPINRGNSGGPLIDADGYLVGINTFILTESGGSEGLGFAVPASVVNYVYRELREHGHVHHGEIGAVAQTITPLLAAGLGLPQAKGVIVSDVFPGSSAEVSGLKVRDIILKLDGAPVEGLPTFQAALYTHAPGDTLRLQVLRGDQKIDLKIPVKQAHNDTDRLADVADPEKNLIAKLGIIGSNLDGAVANLLDDPRATTGVVVAARVRDPLEVDTALVAGDIIHAVNQTQVASIAELRGALEKVRPGDPLVLQVEHRGKLSYMACEME